jgi:hypothetical protein
MRAWDYRTLATKVIRHNHHTIKQILNNYATNHSIIF